MARLFVVEARNLALQGRIRPALDAFREAVDRGWRDPVFERHNPVWDGLREEPEFVALMARAEADVKAQRERIERLGRDETFETALQAAVERISTGR